MGRKKNIKTSTPKRTSSRLALAKKDLVEAQHSLSSSKHADIDDESSSSSSSFELHEAFKQIQEHGMYLGKNQCNMDVKRPSSTSTLQNVDEFNASPQKSSMKKGENDAIFGHGGERRKEVEENSILGKKDMHFFNVSKFTQNGNENDNSFGSDKTKLHFPKVKDAIFENSNPSYEDFPPLAGHITSTVAHDKAAMSSPTHQEMPRHPATSSKCPMSSSSPNQPKILTTSIGQKRYGSRPHFTPNTSAPTSNWKGLFAKNIHTSLKMQACPYKKVNGKRVVEPPPLETYLEGENYWKNSLVGQFIGVPPPLHIIRSVINKAWRKFGGVEVKSNGRGLYVFQFESEEDCNDVSNQIWHIYNRPLLLRKWEPNMEFVNFTHENVPIWVKFYNVPLSLWSNKGLSYVATHIGEPLQMDNTTEARMNLEYARVCVEVNLDDDLPNSIEVVLQGGKKAKVDVEYMWKPKKCTLCNIVGHSNEQCPKAQFKVQKELPKQSWVVVNRSKTHEKPVNVEGNVEEVVDEGKVEVEIDGHREEQGRNEVSLQSTKTCQEEAMKKESKKPKCPQTERASPSRLTYQASSNKFELLIANELEQSNDEPSPMGEPNHIGEAEGQASPHSNQ